MKRLENWKEQLKNPYFVTFVVIFILAIVLRLYYFFITTNQPLWWDESDYLAYAKNLAGLSSNWIITAQHNSLYPFLVSPFYMVGLGEATAKFFIHTIPSIALVFLVYKITLSMYDRKIALITSFLMATNWVVLFNSSRFHVGIPALFFGLLAMYIFWQGYEKKRKIFGLNYRWAIPLATIFIMVSYVTRRGYFLFGIFLFSYLILTRNWKKLIKDKYNWIAVGIFLTMLFLAENFIFISDFGGVAQSYVHPENELNLLPFKVFNSYFAGQTFFMGNLLVYLFWIGVIVILSNLLLSIGYISKSKKGFSKPDLFNILSIITTLLFFILVLRPQNIFGEPRWYFPLLFGSLICISRGATKLIEYLTKNKKIVFIILIILFIFTGLLQLNLTNNLIHEKKNSFNGLKEAGLLIREISNQESLIISQAMPQTIYYSEREVLQPEHITGVEGKSYSLEDFLKGLEDFPNAKYLLISFSEPGHPEWMKKINYVNYEGKTLVASWEIPFMDTKIDFLNGEQEVKQSVNYGNINFNLLDIKQDVFIYEINF